MNLKKLPLLLIALASLTEQTFANETENPNDPDAAETLQTVKVTAKTQKKEPLSGYSNTITKEQISHSPNGNGDIGSALKVLPNVQFEKAQNSSLTPGEIDPAKISISGGQSWQNSFLIDGVSINNDLDPNNSNGHWLGRPPGRSQGMAIDSSLLESIKVHDSNISAAYGGFSGGVVEAETRRPEKNMGLKISHQYTNGNIAKGFPGSLTKYHLFGTEKDFDNFVNSFDDRYQPEFKKHITRASFESLINEQWSVLGSFNQTKSIIPLRRSDDSYLSSGSTSGRSFNRGTPVDPTNSATAKQNQERSIDNYFLKVYFDPSPDLGFEFSYTYAPDYRKEFMVGTQDDYYEFKHGGNQASFKTIWDNAFGKLSNTLSYSKLSDETIAHGYDKIKYWQASDAKKWSNWATWTREGGYAPGVSYQNTISNKIIQEFKPFELGNTTHNILAGIEIEHEEGDFSYSKDFWAAVKSSTFMTAEQQKLCQQTDLAWCDPAPAYDPRGFEKIDGANVVEHEWFNKMTGKNETIGKWQYGQYFESVSIYKKGKIKVNNKQLGAFLEDEIKIPLKQYGEIYLRPGVRLDHNSYMHKLTWAPRFSIDYGLPWNQTKPQYATHLTGGINRYYGRNIYAIALNDGIQNLSSYIYRSSPGNSWQSIIDEGRICEPTQRERDPVTKKWKYHHFKNGVRIEGRDTECVQKNKNNTLFSELKSPYSDEFMIGLQQNIGLVNVAAKYIHRNGRDEVVKSRRDTLKLNEKEGYIENYYTYTNDGKSKTDVITLYLENTRPFVLGSVRNSFSLALDKTDVKRNKNSYDDFFSKKDLYNEWVLWDGKLIRWSDRPTDNFVKPYTLKLNTHHEWNMARGTWYLNNFFNFKAGYQANVTQSSWDKKGQDLGIPHQKKISVYKVVDLPSTFTWDMRIGAEYKFYKENSFFFNIDVYNILNKKNIGLASISRSSGDLTPTYETGRQFWLELGYKF